MQYRRDIDGLRSVAIIPVVLFHAGLEWISGGYVGVDVFFVISGFLITSVIMSAVERGTFSFAHFYERRARRLLPALFAVLVFSLAVGALIMSPVQFRDMGAAMIATVFYVANILMWRRSGYFEGAAETDPMLHMWSLSVEEQFYIFYPILLLLVVRRFGRNPFAAVALISAASLALSVWGVKNAPNPTFFLLPTRAWELGAGALVALSVVGTNWSPALRNTAGLAGFAMIAFAVLAYQPGTPFPGLAAVPPVLGTALIIAAGRGGSNAVARLLSWTPLVGIGLISYSLYLWHWPILVFLNIHYGLHQVPDWAMALGVGASVLLAHLSWRYVERPFRSSDGFGRRRIFQLSGAGIAAATVVGAALVATQGLSARFDAATNAAFRTAEINPFRARCMGHSTRDTLCTLGVDDKPATFVLWGDSHAMSAAHGIDLAARAQNRAGLLAAQSDCPPVLGVSGSPLHNGPDCERFRRAVLDLIEAEDTITDVVLHARWARYTEPRLAWDVYDPPVFELRDSALRPFGGQGYSRNFMDEGLIAAVRRLRAAGKTVHVMEGVPEQAVEVPDVVGRHLGFDAPLPPPADAAQVQGRAQLFERVGPALRDLGAHQYVVSDRFCEQQGCIYVQQDVPLYEDTNHLSLEGSALAFSDFDFASGAGSDVGGGNGQ